MQTRKIFKIGGKSYVVTLPPDWVKKLSSPEVAMVYDGILIVVPKDHAGLLDEAMEQAIRTIASKGAH